MDPDSNTRFGVAARRSRSAGTFAFGLTRTKPSQNCSPALMSTSHASYSAPACPASSSSSNINVTLTPLGVAIEYS
jgi:hypothetical protein